MFGIGLVGKCIMQVLYEAHDIRFLELELHLAFVYFSDVHKLVDEAQKAFGVAVDYIVTLLAFRIGVRCH